MAGHGPPPSPTRRRRNKDPEPEQVLEVTGELHGPELPAGVLPDIVTKLPDGKTRRRKQTWHPQTVALWDALRRSPLMAEEIELGWLFLVDTMLMHHTMWAAGRWEFASEVRLRLAKYGATPEDRLRLRLKVTTPKKDGEQDEKPAEQGAAATASRRRGLKIV